MKKQTTLSGWPFYQNSKGIVQKNRKGEWHFYIGCNWKGFVSRSEEAAISFLNNL